MVFWIVLSSLKFALVGKMWGKILVFGKQKSAVSYCLTAPCFSLRPALLVPEVPRAGVEPARVAPLVFETSASTDSAIWACVARLCSQPKAGAKVI